MSEAGISRRPRRLRMTVRPATEVSDPFEHVPPSLARASTGDEVLVEGIVFDLVRTLCADRGIRVGDRLRVQDRKGGAVTVRNVKGRTVRVRSPYAFFVRVRQIPRRFTEAPEASR